MRVLLVCEWFLKYVGPFAEALRRAEPEVALLCRDHAAEFGGDRVERDAVLARLRAAGVTVIELPGRNGTPSRAAARAIHEARRWRADVVHAQSEILDPRMLLVTERRPLALTVHDPRPHLGAAAQRADHRLAQALWRRRADMLLVHGRRMAVDLRTNRPIRIIPHGMTPHDAPQPPPAEPTVLLFGRLEYYKGVRQLLAAMDLLWKERPEVRLVIAGKGSEQEAIPRDPRIDALHGYIPEADVDDLFARASVVALPYLDASQSGVGLLALGRGIPTVVTDVGDLPDLVPDDSFVAPPGDAETLAARLAAHLDHDISFRVALLRRASAIFGWHAVADRALTIYDELIDARRADRGRSATLRSPAA